MDKKLINRLAVTIEKINYLYRNIRKREENMQKLELALLKKYVTELYDGLVEVELELKQDGASGLDLHPLEHREQQIIARAKEEQITPKPEAQYTAPVVEAKPEPEIVIPTPEPQVDAVPEPEEEPEVIVLPEPVELPEPEPVATIFSVPQQEDEDETDDAATAYMHTFRHKTDESTPIAPPAVQEEEEIIVDAEGAIKTQILSDLQKSQILQQTNLDDFDDTDETVAMELNDVLGKQAKELTVAEKFAAGNGGADFAIGASQRTTYINHLFGGDEEAYDHAIDDLATSKGYIEALTYVNLNLRYDYKWDDHDPIVREFLDIIKAKFLGKFSGS
ncbi:MAG TPA: hypothetical protein PK239_03890 [Chitinophagales bacterium]|nr:hypothetical protein [Chitinophagales bacterium]HRK26412.1 hypothetical protein [Chitinophagales bacterium]